MYRAEMLKLRSTRAAWVIASVAIGGMLVVQGFLVALPRVLEGLTSATGPASGLSAELAPDLGALADPATAAFQRTVLDLLDDVTEPVLRPLRALIPPIRAGGVGIDLSIIIAFVILLVLRSALCS